MNTDAARDDDDGKVLEIQQTGVHSQNIDDTDQDQTSTQQIPTQCDIVNILLTRTTKRRRATIGRPRSRTTTSSPPSLELYHFAPIVGSSAKNSELQGRQASV